MNCLWSRLCSEFLSICHGQWLAVEDASIRCGYKLPPIAKAGIVLYMIS